LQIPGSRLAFFRNPRRVACVAYVTADTRQNDVIVPAPADCLPAVIRKKTLAVKHLRPVPAAATDLVLKALMLVFFSYEVALDTLLRFLPR